MKHMLDSIAFWVFMAVFTTTLVIAVSQAKAGEPDHQTINNIIHKDENQGKGIIIGMLLACRLNAARAALLEGRWWTWCGEKKSWPVDNELSK